VGRSTFELDARGYLGVREQLALLSLPPQLRRRLLNILAVFDGPTSKIKVGTSPIVEGATGVSLSGRNILGGQGSALATAGLVGGYAFIRAYDRALNNSDIEAASVELHRAYGLM